VGQPGGLLPSWNEGPAKGGGVQRRSEEVDGNGQASALEPPAELVYQPMLEVLSYLRNNAFKTYIVTGGGHDFVRVYAERVYGIPPEQVVGSTLDTSTTTPFAGRFHRRLGGVARGARIWRRLAVFVSVQQFGRGAMLLKYAGGAIRPQWLGPLDGPLSVCRVINKRASAAIAGRTMGPRQFDDDRVLASPLDSPAAVRLNRYPSALRPQPCLGRVALSGRTRARGWRKQGLRHHRVSDAVAQCGSEQNALGSIVTSHGASYE